MVNSTFLDLKRHNLCLKCCGELHSLDDSYGNQRYFGTDKNMVRQLEKIPQVSLF